MAKKGVEIVEDMDAAELMPDVPPEMAAVNPMIHLLFDFFLDPRATPLGYAYGIFLCLLVSLHLLIVGLQTCDGPNQYPAGDSSHATYKFLLTDEQYWTATSCVTIPLVIDAVFRLILLVGVFLAENPVLRRKLTKSTFNMTLTALDFVSLIPFCVESGYLRPNNIQLSSGATIIYEVIDIMIVNRIFRVTKDMPAIWAIRIALARSVEHLIIPFFVFLMFNITAAVIFFFAEPCYDIETCAWHDLFEAMFFSVVTMTSVGYGNQTPKFALGRFVACMVMVFGAVFMSMPLAIIGNEYSIAWQEVSKVLAAERDALTIAKEEGTLGSKPGDGNKAHFMFARQESAIAPLATLASISAVRGSLLKTQAASRAAMLALSASISSTIGNSKNVVAPSQAGSGGNKSAVMAAVAPALTKAAGNDGEKDNVDSDDGNIRPAAATFENDGAPREVNSSTRPKRATLTISNGKLKRSAVTMPVSSVTANDSIIEAHRRILEGSTIVGTHKRITALLDDLPLDKLGSRMSPLLLMHICELRSLTHSLLTSTEHPIDYLTKSIQQAQAQQSGRSISIGHNLMRRASAFGSISSSLASLFHSNRTINRTSVENISGNAPRMSIVKINPHHVAPGLNTSRHGEAPKITRLSSLQTGQTATQAVEELETVDNSLIASIYRFLFGKTESENETDFQVMMKKVAKDPNSLRNRMWMLLELHQSSREARMVQWVILSLILLSVLLMFTETLSTWSNFGESSIYCESVVKAYCRDKDDPLKDPGCFVQNYPATSYFAYQHSTYHNGSVYTPSKLDFYCEELGCYGVGNNFGGNNSSLSCDNPGSSDDGDDVVDDLGNTLADDYAALKWTRPFQLREELLNTYGNPTMFTSRPAMHRQSAICNRVECNPPTARLVNGNQIWVKAEVFIAVIFSIELCMRIAVADSVLRYFKDVMNTFDILAILPFYIDVYAGRDFDFSIVPSSPQNYLIVISRSFKVFRMFKVVRHFDATKVLIETAQKTLERLLGILGFLTFLVVVFAIMLYEVEKGRACYQGDPGCPFIVGIKPGQRYLINKLGEVSQIPDVFYGLWFCFATLTTTGYGDIVSITNTGQVMTVFLMLAGSCYLSMPLAVAASTFYDVHRHYMKRKEAPIGAGALALANDMALKKKKDMEWKRRLILIKGSFHKYRDMLENLINDMQQPVTPSTHPGHDHCAESELIKMVVGVCVPMRKTMMACSEDIVQLVLAIASGQIDDDS